MKKELKNENFYNQSQNNFGSFSSDKENIASRINESRTKNRMNVVPESSDEETIENNEPLGSKDQLTNKSEVDEPKVEADNIPSVKDKIINTLKSKKETEKKGIIKYLLSPEHRKLRIFLIGVLGVIGLFLIVVLMIAVFENMFGSLEIFYSEGDNTTFDTFKDYEVGYDTSQTVNLVENQINSSTEDNEPATTCGDRGFFQKIKNDILGIYDMSDATESCFYNLERVKYYQVAILKSNFFYVEDIDKAYSIDIDESDIDQMHKEYALLSKTKKEEVYRDLEENNSIDSEIKTLIPTIYSYSQKIGRNPLTISNEDVRNYKKSLSEIKKNKNVVGFYPGVIYSTFYYAYETQRLDENGNNTIIVEFGNENETNEIKLSALNTLISNKIINKNDIENMYKATVKKGYRFYTYIEPADEEDEGYCSVQYSSTAYDEHKLELFLRYGQAASNDYETKTNDNEKLYRTSEKCLSKHSGISETILEGFSSKVDIDDKEYKLVSAKKSGKNVLTASNSDGEYNYRTGFIYSKFPRYMSKYNNNTTVGMDYLVAREIELIIANIYDKKEYMDIFLGYKSDGSINSSTIIASGDWTTWKQTDPAWGSLVMATATGKTIARMGCFFTSLAMSIAKSAKNIVLNNFNPGTLLLEAQKKGLVSSRGLVGSGDEVINLATGNQRHEIVFNYLNGSLNDKASQIAGYINSGYDVMLRVKSPEGARILASRGYGDTGEEHWVLVTGVEGTTIHIADPGYNITTIPSSSWRYINEGITEVQLIKYL